MYVFQRVRRPETPEIESIHLSLDPCGPGAVFKVISLPLLLGSYLGHYKSWAELLSPFFPPSTKPRPSNFSVIYYITTCMFNIGTIQKA